MQWTVRNSVKYVACIVCALGLCTRAFVGCCGSIITFGDKPTLSSSECWRLHDEVYVLHTNLHQSAGGYPRVWVGTPECGWVPQSVGGYPRVWVGTPYTF
jgi:hypothetical protein